MANQKTWLPKLLLLAQALCKYIRRYEDKIKSMLPEGGPAAVDAVLLACDALETVILLVIPPAT